MRTLSEMDSEEADRASEMISESGSVGNKDS
jgi:hypothetical protein